MADETDAADGPTEKSRTAGGGFGRRAVRSLRRARGIYDAGEWQPSVEADFHVREATAYALMDLAEAIRERDTAAPTTGGT